MAPNTYREITAVLLSPSALSQGFPYLLALDCPSSIDAVGQSRDPCARP